jgi:hypothetical protein
MIGKAFVSVRLGNLKAQQPLAYHRTQRLNPTWQGNFIDQKGGK